MCAGSEGTENRKGSVSDAAENNVCSPTKVQRTCSFWEFSVVQHCKTCVYDDGGQQAGAGFRMDADCLEQECRVDLLAPGKCCRTLSRGVI